ncbi:hypothetical protein B0H14DRAFT_3452873 [Mycena olivaceomarginata]|nr:hypothetical protein B0H14DRAFT_3452873 [Mycena olivaceomarginata]
MSENPCRDLVLHQPLQICLPPSDIYLSFRQEFTDFQRSNVQNLALRKSESYTSAPYSFAFDFSVPTWIIPKFRVVSHPRSCQFPQSYPGVMDADGESVERPWLVMTDGMRVKAKL